MEKDAIEKVESPECLEASDTPEPTPSELEQLEQELEATRDQLLRTLADFENYRRRIEKEAESIGQAGKRDLLLGLLDVMDSFDQASHLTAEEAEASQGLQAIHRQLLNLLESHGVKPFHSLGEKFDPQLHEAVDTVEAEEVGVEPGTIVQEYQKGYRWDGRVLRPARVQVAR